jgi:predicted phosphodiesterase
MSRLAIVGDAHFTSQDDIASTLAALAQDVDEIVLLGDNVDISTEENCLALKQGIEACTIPVRVVIGNHEANCHCEGGTARWERYFGALEYSWGGENSHFIVLNNSHREVFDFDKIEGLLRASENKYKYRFVFMHQPLLPTPPGHSIDKQKDRLVRLLEKYGVSCMFYAHLHHMAVGIIGRIPFRIVGYFYHRRDYSVLEIGEDGWNVHDRFIGDQDERY